MTRCNNLQLVISTVSALRLSYFEQAKKDGIRNWSFLLSFNWSSFYLHYISSYWLFNVYLLKRLIGIKVKKLHGSTNDDYFYGKFEFTCWPLFLMLTTTWRVSRSAVCGTVGVWRWGGRSEGGGRPFVIWAMQWRAGSRGSLVLSRRSTHQEAGCSGRDEAAAGRGTAPSTLSQSVDYWKLIQLDQAAVREFCT